MSLDFIVQLPQSTQGNDSIVCIVDRLSKRVHLAAVKSSITAPAFARVFTEVVFKHHGMPETLVSDRDSKFISEFWRSLFKLLGTHLNISTAYHPQTDGQTERMNRQLEQVLRHFTNAQQSNWEDQLPMVEFAMNSHVSSTTGFSPFQLDTGMAPATPLSMLAPLDPEVAAQVPVPTALLMDEWRQSLEVARIAMREAQERYAAYADLHRTDRAFKAKDRVYLSTANLSLKANPAKAFRPRWIGPFEITRVVSPVAYELKLPRTMGVHPVFHVSLLKPVETDPLQERPATPEPEFDDEGEQVWVVREILKHRYRGTRNGMVLEYLVRWAAPYDSPEQDSWEPKENLDECTALDDYEAELARRGLPVPGAAAPPRGRGRPAPAPRPPPRPHGRGGRRAPWSRAEGPALRYSGPYSQEPVVGSARRNRC